MNRRAFFQAAALSTVAVAQGKGLAHAPLQADATCPGFQANIAAPGALAHIGRREIDLFVSLEEADPADPGELSGARLWISDAGDYVCLSAGIGDTLQSSGDRTSHLLGFVEGPVVSVIASRDPRNPEDGFTVRLQNAQNGRTFGWMRLELLAGGDDPQLALYLADHCLGVLRGDLLQAFFRCLRIRCEGALAH
jgi:hypothetical protein